MTMNVYLQFSTLQHPVSFHRPLLVCIVHTLCRRNNQLLVKIGDKEVDSSPEFKLYITTKLANPNYTPEVSTKAMIVNFAVKESGLEAQLLNTVVKNERPDLDKQKNDLVVKVGLLAWCVTWVA